MTRQFRRQDWPLQPALVLLLTCALVNAGCANQGTGRLDCFGTSVDPLSAANCLSQENEHGEAVAAFGVIAADDPGSRRDVAQRLGLKGTALYAEGEFASARLYLEESTKIARALGDDRLLSRGLVQLGETSYRLGDYSRARQYMEEAKPMLAVPGQRSLFVQNGNNLGNTLSNLGQFAEAETELVAVYDEAKATGNRGLIAVNRLNLGALRYNLRQYASAIEALDEAERLIRSSGDVRLQIAVANAKGATFRQQGDFASALDEYEIALAIGRRNAGKFGNELGTTERITAELLIYTPIGDHETNLATAKEYLINALGRHQGNPVDEGMALSHLGEYSLERHDLSAAIQYFEQARERFESVDYPDGVGRSRINLGRARNAQALYPEAVEEFDAAASIYGQLRDREWLRVAYFGRGLAHEKMGDVDAAMDDYKSSVAQLESIRLDVHGDQAAQILFTEVNSDVYQRLVDLFMRQGDVAGALEYINRSRLKQLNEYLQESRGIVPVAPQDQETDDAARATLVWEHARRMREEAVRAAVRGNREVRIILDEAAEDFVSSNGFASQSAAFAIEDTLGFIRTDRLRDYPATAAIVTYFPTPRATYIIVARGGTDAVGIALKDHGKQPMRQLVVAALKEIELGDGRPTSPRSASPESGDVLEVLHEILIEPVAEYLEGVETLVIYPHDYLVHLPFEALRSRGDVRYLVQQGYDLIYLHSFDDDLRLTSDESQSRESLPRSAAVFANPFVPDLAALPFAEAEGVAIERALPGSLLFTGPSATKQEFEKHWGKFEIVHVAAHAAAEPDGSYLHFARAGEHDDGRLTLRDIRRLPESERTQLLVLSACQSALDVQLESAPADDPIAALGLAALLHAFVNWHDIQSRIGSLWQVNDASTAILMGKMYKHLADAPDIRPYDAFRSAQIEMIEAGGEYSRPFHWAAFVFYGAPD